MARNGMYDVAKALGMLCVLTGHLAYANSLPMRVVHSFHMPLFFIISGVFFDKVLARTWRDQVLKMYSEMFLPAVLFILAGMVTFPLRGTALPLSFTKLLQWLESLYRGHPFCNPPIWFLFALIGGILVAKLIMRVLGRFEGRLIMRCLTVIVLGIISCVMMRPQVTRFCPLMMSDWSLVALFVFLGFWFSKIRLINLSTVKALTVFIVSMLLDVLVARLMTVSSMSDGVMSSPLFIVTGGLGTVAILAFSHVLCQVQVVSGALEWLGRNSLYVFGLDFVTRPIWICLAKCVDEEVPLNPVAERMPLYWTVILLAFQLAGMVLLVPFARKLTAMWRGFFYRGTYDKEFT